MGVDQGRTKTKNQRHQHRKKASEVEEVTGGLHYASKSQNTGDIICCSSHKEEMKIEGTERFRLYSRRFQGTISHTINIGKK